MTELINANPHVFDSESLPTRQQDVFIDPFANLVPSESPFILLDSDHYTICNNVDTEPIDSQEIYGMQNLLSNLITPVLNIYIYI